MAYRPRRQARYESLRNSGFMRFEANELSSVTLAEAPYLRDIIADRRKLLRAFLAQARLNKWSTTKSDEEYRKVIRQEYIDHGWIREKEQTTRFMPEYKASPWEMLKEYRQKAIESGEYFPVPRKRVRRDASGKPIAVHISKGDVKAQKRREKNRIHAMRGTPDYESYLRRRREQKRRARQKEHGGGASSSWTGA